MIILKFFLIIIAALFFVVLATGAVLVTKYLMWFHYRPCKYCGHSMEYKGLKEGGGSGHYLFHCPKCGAWEEISQEMFLREEEKTD